MVVNRESRANAGGGITLSGLVFIVFLVLKLCNVINWSWWWVTAPLWIPIATAATIFMIVVLYYCIKALVVYIMNRTLANKRR
jgi:hypothetical protein